MQNYIPRYYDYKEKKKDLYYDTSEVTCPNCDSDIHICKDEIEKCLGCLMGCGDDFYQNMLENTTSCFSVPFVQNINNHQYESIVRINGISTGEGKKTVQISIFHEACIRAGVAGYQKGNTDGPRIKYIQEQGLAERFYLIELDTEYNSITKIYDGKTTGANEIDDIPYINLKDLTNGIAKKLSEPGINLFLYTMKS